MRALIRSAPQILQTTGTLANESMVGRFGKNPGSADRPSLLGGWIDLQLACACDDRRALDRSE